MFFMLLVWLSDVEIVFPEVLSSEFVVGFFQIIAYFFVMQRDLFDEGIDFFPAFVQALSVVVSDAKFFRTQVVEFD